MTIKNDPILIAQEQIQWYNHNADVYKWWHRILKVVLLVSSASIPVLSVCNSSAMIPHKDLVIACIGALITILAGILELFKFNEKRLKYRKTANELVCEMYMHIAQKTTADEFLKRIAAIIRKGHRAWEDTSNQEKTTT
jgi:hypothetical protein